MQQTNPVWPVLAPGPPPLDLPLDPQSHVPLYLQLRDTLRGLIASGRLGPGQRLAPTRDLARQLGVNRTTVAAAYAELEADGMLEGHVGRGTFVAGHPVRPRPAPAPLAAGSFSWESYIPDNRSEEGLDALVRASAEPGAISFAAAHPPLRVLPWAEFRRACETVLRRQGREILRPGPSDGHPPLKAWLAAFLRQQGMPAQAEHITITNGCQQSLDLVAKALVEPGQAVVLENPVYPGALAPLVQRGAVVLPVPVGAEGMDLAALEATLERHRVRLILVSPSFQNPTSASLTLESRRRLLELARAHQVPVVENDSYGFLGFSGPALPSLQSLDQSGQVITIGSFSKIGFPGLRLGWCVAPPEAGARLRRAKQATDLHTDGFVQAVMEEFAQRGGLARAIAAVRQACAANAAVLAREVQRHFPPEVRWHPPAGGMSAWFTLPPALDAAQVLARSAERQVIFTPGRYFYFHAPQANTLRLSFGSLDAAAIAKGVAVLGQAIRAEWRHTRRAAGKGVGNVAGWPLV